MTRFGRADLAVLAESLAAAARAEVMPRFRRLTAGQVRTKSGPFDLVTEADEAAERHITAALGRAFPAAIVVGEEAASADPARLAALAGAEWAIVVDPVDGTANFAAGLPLFGNMAAVIMRGEVVAAVIHDPVLRETSLARRGEGAWREDDNGRSTELRVARPVPPAEMNGAVSWRYLPEPQRSQVCQALPGLAEVFHLRCAAHEYRLAASGQCHLLLYGRLLPWDHAPGWLLHHEAGGYAACFDGSPYRPARREGGLLCAPDAASWHAARAWLLGTSEALP